MDYYSMINCVLEDGDDFEYIVNHLLLKIAYDNIWQCVKVADNVINLILVFSRFMSSSLTNIIM